MIKLGDGVDSLFHSRSLPLLCESQCRHGTLDDATYWRAVMTLGMVKTADLSSRQRYHYSESRARTVHKAQKIKGYCIGRSSRAPLFSSCRMRLTFEQAAPRQHANTAMPPVLSRGNSERESSDLPSLRDRRAI